MKRLTVLFTAVIAANAHAGFAVDNEGLDVEKAVRAELQLEQALQKEKALAIEQERLEAERAALSEQKAALAKKQARAEGLAPSGFRVLTDKQVGVVSEVGSRPGSITGGAGAGSEMFLDDALAMLMPDAWVAYIREDAPDSLAVSWDVGDGSWLDALNQIGANLDVRFVLDWDEKAVRIGSNTDFRVAQAGGRYQYKDEETGRDIYVFSADPMSEYRRIDSDQGVVVVGSEAVAVQVVE